MDVDVPDVDVPDDEVTGEKEETGWGLVEISYVPEVFSYTYVCTLPQYSSSMVVDSADNGVVVEKDTRWGLVGLSF